MGNLERAKAPSRTFLIKTLEYSKNLMLEDTHFFDNMTLSSSIGSFDDGSSLPSRPRYTLT